LDVPTGDVVGGRLSDKVFNDLRHCGKLEAKRQVRLKDKDEKATTSSSVDATTRLILFKWIQNREFDFIDGVIATGKESVVLHAVSQTGGEPVDQPKEEEGKLTENEDDEPIAINSNARPLDGSGSHFAIKVYKTTLAGFRNRSEYVKDDFRFKNPRRVMKVWAEKEFMNLQRLKRANLPCPTAIRLKKHVLLMSLIGEQGVAAPKLKEVEWSGEEMKKTIFAEVKELMVRMFRDCKLVHGDLSEFNLLLHKVVYVIDVAQAMDLSHPKALVFLQRDVQNVLDFFGRIGTDALPSAHQLFSEITGIPVDEEKDLLSQVDSFERENRSANVRRNKARPADLELSLYQAESQRSDSQSPARQYN